MLKRSTARRASAGSRKDAFLQQVAIHHAAVRRQRVQADQGGDRIGVGGQRQLADQAQPVRGWAA